MAKTFRKVLVLVTIIITVCLGGCSPKHSSYSDFCSFTNVGWLKDEAVRFVPEYGDSLSRYDVKVSLCYDNSFRYKYVSIVVDFIKSDKLSKRNIVKCELADDYGNWKTPGFGTSYQLEKVVAKNIAAADLDKVVMWQGMDCDTLAGITGVGIIIEPTVKK